jgi:hypothetical protein
MAARLGAVLAVGLVWLGGSEAAILASGKLETCLNEGSVRFAPPTRPLRAGRRHTEAGARSHRPIRALPP